MRLLLSFLVLLWATITLGSYQVGVSLDDLSPSEEEISTKRIFLGGYGILGFRDGAVPKPATGVHDPMWSRTMILSDGNSTLSITVLDTTGITNKILNRIRNEAGKQTGIPVENIFVSATHTHCGPDLQGLWGGVTDSYLDFVVNGTVNSIVSAFKSRRSVDLYVSGATGFARNRRDWPYTDDEMTVIDAIDSITGQRVAVLVNFAAHPTVLGSDVREVSGDWPNYLRIHAESFFEAPVVFHNGAIGDASPTPRSGNTNFERAESYGKELAEIAFQSIQQQSLVKGEIYIKTVYFTLDVTNILFILAINLGLADYEYEGGPARGYKITTRASYFRLGSQVQGVSFPGESLTRNAEPIKGAMITSHKLFLGLSGDTLGYFIPTDEWETGRNGNYEESISLDQYAGDIARDNLIQLIKEDPIFV